MPETPIPSGFCLQECENVVDPLADSDEYGIDLYIDMLNRVGMQ